MTTSEFKAWFEGYTENISKVPTQKQWARINERVLELTKDDEKTCTVYRDDRRSYPYRPWWPDWSWTGTSSGSFTIQNCSDNMTYNAATNYLDASDGTVPETFVLAMAHEIGCDEAAADAG